MDFSTKVFMKLFFCTVMALLWFTGSLLSNIQLPDGEYRKTCDCSFEHPKQLACLCLKDLGMREYSEIDPVTCSGQEIVNSQGKLMCRQYSRDRLPQGSYIDSCYDCAYVDPDKLSCLCRRVHERSSIDPRVCQDKDIVNCGGFLGCKGICELQENRDIPNFALPLGVLVVIVLLYHLKTRHKLHVLG